MENNQQPRPRKPYITPRLKVLAAQLPDYPMILLWAPVGCGKTVAAGYLARHFKGQAFRMNLDTYNPDTFWIRFCSQLAPGIDPESPMPVLAGAICRKGPVLVLIDDYQKAQSPQLSQRLLELALALPERLKIMICSRHRVFSEDSEPVCKGQVLLIQDRDLLLDEKEIIPFCRSCQVRVSTAQAHTLYAATQGWMMAVFLMLTDFVRTGQLRLSAALPRFLMTQVDQLEAPLGRFVYLLAPCGDGFTLEQARFLWQEGDAAPLLERLVDQGFFLQHDLEEGEYRFYPLLAALLTSQLKGRRDQGEIYLRHGQWYESQGKAGQALACFARGGQSQALLHSMDCLTRSQAAALDPWAARDWLTCCQIPELTDHPAALLHFLWLFSAYGIDGPAAQCRQLYQEARQKVSDPELAAGLDATFVLTEGCLSCQPALFFSQLERVTTSLPGGCSVPLEYAGGLYGSPSLLSIWGKGEGLAQTAELFQKGESKYPSAPLPLTGLGDLARGELLYFSGDLEESQILAHRLRRQAQGTRLPHLLLGATALEARILFANGKVEKLKNLLDQAQSRLEELDGRRGPCLAGLDILEGWFWASSQHPGQPPAWIRQGEWDQVRLSAPLKPLALACQALILCRLGKHTQVLSLERELVRSSNTLPVRLYGHLALAMASQGLNHPRRAEYYLQEAIRLARPDGLVMPFVELYSRLEEILARVQPDWEPCREQIPQLGDQFGSTMEIPVRLASQNSAGLTPREVEIATLAAQGMYNREISQKLDISENTIKSTLKNIFSKLDIHSRRELPQALDQLLHS